MPALHVFNRYFHLAGDDVPLFSLFGAIFHCAWVVLIFISGKDILNMPQQCHHQGKQYIAVVSGLLLAFLTGFILEILLICEGCRGAVFELSKRKRMPFYLMLRLTNLIVELIFTAYGSYVVWGTQLRCKVSETIIFSPKREIMVLIILTWCFQVLTLLNAALWYNMWPENDMPERWENRFIWIGRYICCQFRPYAAGDKEKSTKEYQSSLRRIARWVNKVIGNLDLTPSDSALALVLVATLQRRARREKIAESLQSAKAGSEGLRAISLMERANTIRTLPEAGAAPARAVAVPFPGSRSFHEEEDVVQLSPPEGGSPIMVKAELTAGLMEKSLSFDEAEEEEAEAAHEGESEAILRTDHERNSDAPETAPQSLGSRSPLENFQRQMALLKRACLTPSSMDEDLRGDMPAEDAVQLYTGGHWRVPAELLAEVEHFARFAVGVYGFDIELLRQRNWWQTLKKAIRWRRTEKGRDAVNRSKMKELYQRLFYEGVEQEIGQSSELLYVSVENQALSHLPYIIALDHSSRSVVVAIRGTWSMEDIITDSVAEPERLTDWLPKPFRDEHGKEAEQMWAHGGIVGAAEAILLDLEANSILKALLDGDYSAAMSAPEQETAERAASGSKAESTSSQAQGHFVAAIMNRKLECKGWRLVVTGHSLGAGAAALIAIKLYGRFTDVRCWAFSPPGGLMSKNLSRAVEPFVTSVVVGKDVVPRLSVVNIGRLIDQMVSGLALCKHNKNKMLLRHLTSHWRHGRTSELFWEYNQVPEEALRVLQAYAAGIEARNRMLELVPPGNVILLRALKMNGERHSWDAVWVKAEEIIREGILVSPQMANDHYALTLQAALASAQGYTDEESAGPRYFPPTPLPEPEAASSSAAGKVLQT